jgi:hypothetical protein
MPNVVRRPGNDGPTFRVTAGNVDHYSNQKLLCKIDGLCVVVQAVVL